MTTAKVLLIAILVSYFTISVGMTFGYISERKSAIKNIGHVLLVLLLSPIFLITAIGIKIHNYLDNHIV